MSKSKKVARLSKAVLATDSKNYSDYAIEHKSIDKSCFKITCALLDKMIREAKDSAKVPLLVLRLPKDKDSSYVLNCVLSVERKV